MTTCENLTLPGFDSAGSTESTPSAAGSPARTSASRARVPAWTVSDPASGESFAVSLASFDPASSSWKTLGLSGLEDLHEFSETLPRSGMTHSGTLYLLPPLVRLTSVIASGSLPLLPTPVREDSEQTGPRLRANGTVRSHTLTSMMRESLLPTPTTSDGGSWTPPHGTGMNLRAAAELLPTPLAQDSEQAGGIKAYMDGVRGLSLTTWARLEQAPLLPTPQAQDHRNCADYSDGSREHSPQLRHLGSGRLNPRFVEWMMGFPPGWTDADGLDEPAAPS